MTESFMPFRAKWVSKTVALLSVLSAGCLFDSSYWQQKASQRSVAQQRTPHALAATPAEGITGGPTSRVRAKVLRLRVHATPSYAAEVVEWPRQFARLLEEANRVLEPTLDVRLEVAETRTWSSKVSSDSLEPMLADLRTADPGGDVDGVVGLVGSLPVFVHSFHQLGYAEVMGKHLAIRAMNDAREREAIEIELSRLDADERETLYQSRKRHKATAVFLHELGHNFGLIHEADTASIMSMRYDKSMTAFSVPSAEVMRMTIEHRSGQPQAPSERTFAEHLLQAFERTKPNWVSTERDAMVASLKARLAAPERTAAASSDLTPSAPIDEQALRDVAVPDRAVYAQAAADEKAGRPREGWTKAEPLFARYPDVYAIQDLRCKLALALSSAWEDAREQCERLMSLSRGKPGTKPK